MIGHLRALAGSRELVRYMVIASLKTEHAGKTFGMLWWLADPLLLMAVYTFVVAIIFQRGGPDYPIFILTALVPWKWFTSGVQTAMARTVGGERLMKQVAFLREVLPLAAVLAASVPFAVGLAVVVAFAAGFGLSPGPALLLLPIVALVQLALILGVALFLSALNVSFRDTRNLTAYALRVMFYLSPGLYSVSVVPEAFRDLYMLNPFAVLFPTYRAIILGHPFPDGVAIVRLTVTSLSVLVVGYLFFVRRARYFVKSF